MCGARTSVCVWGGGPHLLCNLETNVGKDGMFLKARIQGTNSIIVFNEGM